MTENEIDKKQNAALDSLFAGKNPHDVMRLSRMLAEGGEQRLASLKKDLAKAIAIGDADPSYMGQIVGAIDATERLARNVFHHPAFATAMNVSPKLASAYRHYKQRGDAEEREATGDTRGESPSQMGADVLGSLVEDPVLQVLMADVLGIPAEKLQIFKTRR